MPWAGRREEEALGTVTPEPSGQVPHPPKPGRRGSCCGPGQRLGSGGRGLSEPMPPARPGQEACLASSQALGSPSAGGAPLSTVRLGLWGHQDLYRGQGQPWPLQMSPQRALSFPGCVDILACPLDFLLSWGLVSGDRKCPSGQVLSPPASHTSPATWMPHCLAGSLQAGHTVAHQALHRQTPVPSASFQQAQTLSPQLLLLPPLHCLQDTGPHRCLPAPAPWHLRASPRAWVQLSPGCWRVLRM